MKRIISILSMIVLIAFSVQAQSPYQEILNGESGLSVRTKINSMNSAIFDNFVEFQFSANDTLWHDEYVAGDKFVRYTSDFGSNYTPSVPLGHADVFIISGDTFRITSPTDGQVLKRENGEWVNTFALIDSLQNVDFFRYIAPPTYRAYRLYPDTTNHTMSIYNDEADVALQLGQEQWTRIYNNSGATILNGRIVKLSGAGSGHPTVTLADKSEWLTADCVLGAATHDIENGTFGYIVNSGQLNGYATDTITAGARLYLGDNGIMTDIRPSYPDYVIEVGHCLVSHATTGKVLINVKGELFDIYQNAFIGAFVDNQKFTVSSNGTTITGTLQRNGGGDLTMNFSDGFSTLDCTPAQTITLTAGTATAPQTNYVYILQSTKALTVSTSDWPADEHIRVAQVACRTAALTQSDGALRNQNWNDHVAKIADNGHISHLNERIRRLPADWYSGVAITTNIVSAADPDNVYISTTGGKVYQMHLQDFPAMAMPDSDMHVVNHPTTPYTTITNLNTQLTDAAGVSLSGKSYSLVIWGIANESGQRSHLMVNLPRGSYGNSADAINDADNYSVYTIPDQFKGVGFLIARVTLTHAVTASGTWTLNSTQDLRGFFPNTAAGGSSGGGGGGVTTFLGLTDTPSAYTGQATKIARVNSGETALEFTAENDPVFALDSAKIVHWTDTLAKIATAYDISQIPGITESDPVFASDSAKLLHWTDTTSKVATQYDLSQISGTSQWTTDANGITYANNVGIGIASQANNQLYVKDSTGSFNYAAIFDQKHSSGNGISLDVANSTGAYPLRIRGGGVANFIVRSDGVLYIKERAATTLSDYTDLGALYAKTDGKIYWRGYTGSTEYDLTSVGTAAAGGVSGNIQYNSSGSLAGFGTWNGSTMTVPGGITSSTGNIAGSGNISTSGGYMAATGNITSSAGSIARTGTNPMGMETGGFMYFSELGSSPATPTSTIGYLYAKSDGKLYFKNDGGTEYNLTEVGTGGTGAPTDATYITQTANSTLTNEQALSSLSTGFAKVTGGTGVVTTQSAINLSNTDVTGNLPVTKLNSGTNASATTFWRGDGSWQTPAGGGNVSNVGTPVDNQVAIWTGATTIEGDGDLTFDGTKLTATGIGVGAGNISLGSNYLSGDGGAEGISVGSTGIVTLSGGLTFGGNAFTSVSTGTSGNNAMVTKGYVDEAITAAGGYTNEMAQDAVGTILNTGGTGNIVFSYDDATPKISANFTEVDGSITNEIELPSQATHSGKFLTTNGTSPSWATAPGSLFTDGGSFTYLTSTTDNLIVGTNSQAASGKLVVNGDARILNGRVAVDGGLTLYNASWPVATIYEYASMGSSVPVDGTYGFLFMDSADDKLKFKTNTTTYDLTASGGSSNWTKSGTSIYPVTITDTVKIGGTTTLGPSAMLQVTGNTIMGGDLLIKDSNPFFQINNLDALLQVSTSDTDEMVLSFGGDPNGGVNPLLYFSPDNVTTGRPLLLSGGALGMYNSSANPSTTSEGTMYYNTVDKRIYSRNSAAYVPIDFQATQSPTFSATLTHNYLLGANMNLTLTGNITINIHNIPDGASGTLLLKQDGTGGKTFAVNTFSDAGTTGLTEVTIGTNTAINDTANKYSTVTYKRFGSVVTVVYGKEN